MTYSKKDLIKIVKIQAIVRGFLQRKRILIPSGKYQTKNWRKKQKWYKGGKCTECEKHQLNIIESITDQKIFKTYARINIDNYKLIEIRNPMTKSDGFEYTENFDGYFLLRNKINVFINLKFICDQGGAQTRSLREVYHFIKAQYMFLRKNTGKHVFINILDGDCSHKYMDKFRHLEQIHKKYARYCFVGDMRQFQDFYIYDLSMRSSK